MNLSRAIRTLQDHQLKCALSLSRRFSVESKRNFDVIIIGGGVMGASTAYFLARRLDPSSICVVERDFRFSLNSSVRSWGSIRQQFSIAENIRMSKFGFHFLQNAQEYLGTDDEEPVDLQLKPGTYCFLASKAGKCELQKNCDIQRLEDVAISLLTKDELSTKYPWLNTENVDVGSNVASGEGWIDPWLLLCHLKKKIAHMGVHIMEREAVDIVVTDSGKISGIKLTKSDGSPSHVDTLNCEHLVNAAGAWAHQVAEKIGIELPVRPSKRVTYVVDCPDGFSNSVLLFDTAQNIYIRPESSKQYIVGEHVEENDLDWSQDLEVDYEYFDTNIWPKLAYRIPAFEKLKVTSAWAGFYDYNTLDQNGIISAHPDFDNFYLANGFSGHGLQQSPAVGRAISELIIDGDFRTIDLSRFSFERFCNNKLVIENNII